jgi:hypothetical protein
VIHVPPEVARHEPLSRLNESEIYKDMTMKEFNKEVDHMSKDARARVSLYIAKAIHAFVQGGKKTIKILYFLSMFHQYFQFCIEI